MERIADLVELEKYLSGDLDVVLLDVFERDDDTLVQTDVGEDLSGARSNTRH